MATITPATADRSEPGKPGVTNRRRFASLPTAIIRDPSLSAIEVRVLLDVASYAWESLGTDCWASHETIGADLGLCRRTVLRTLAKLEARGLVEGQRKSGKTTRYRVRSENRPVTPESQAPVTPESHEEDDRKKTTLYRRPIESREPQRSSSPARDRKAATTSKTSKTATAKQRDLLARLVAEQGVEPPDVADTYEAHDVAISGLIERKKRLRAADAYEGDTRQEYCGDCGHEWDAPLNGEDPCPDCLAPERYCLECDFTWYAHDAANCPGCGGPL